MDQVWFCVKIQIIEKTKESMIDVMNAFSELSIYYFID